MTPTVERGKRQESRQPEPPRLAPREPVRPEATSLAEAANSDNSLEGYAAMNATGAAFEEIQRLAYQLYQERGGEHGSHEDDWYRAERLLQARQGEQAGRTLPT